MPPSAPATLSDVGRRKVGLALGSGSARGLAHIGVLRALEEAGIGIDVVVGTSIGALIGAVYAAGRIDALTATFQTFDWKKTLSFFDIVLPKSGLIDGARVSELVREHVTSASIEELPLRFAAVATDIISGERVIIDHGDVIDAVRASISVPGIFTPVRRGDRILADGGMVDPVPVQVARTLGADFVIAVDLNHDVVAGKNLKSLLPESQAARRAFARWTEVYQRASRDVKSRLATLEWPGAAQLARWSSPQELLPSIFEVLLASINIMETSITGARLALEPPDLLICPPLGQIRFLEFVRAEEIIAAGYAAATTQLRSALRDGPTGTLTS